MTVTSAPGTGGINLKNALATIEKKVGKVGWILGNRYENGEYVAQVAAIQEFGYPSMHIPARPFIFPTIKRERENWAKIGSDGVRAVFEGRTTIENVLELLGKKAAGDIKQTITQVVSPPLSPVTIARRIERSNLSQTKKNNLSSKILSRSKLTSQETASLGLLTKPLEDTGTMRDTCINSVEDV